MREAQKKHPGKAKGLKKKFKLIGSATAEVTGDQISDIAAAQGVVSVTEDAPIQATAYGNLQNWPASVGAQWGDAPRKQSSRRSRSSTRASSREATSADESSGQVDLTTTGANSSGDGFGHGTLVAGLAVGGATASRASSRAPTSCRSTSSTTPAAAGERPARRMRLDPPEQGQYNIESPTSR